MKLHDFRHLIQEGPQAPGRPPAEHHASPNPRVTVFHQEDPSLLPVRHVANGRCGCKVRPMGPVAVMVPDVGPLADQLHVHGFSLPPVRAEVAAAILELLQMVDGVGAAGSGHGANAEWQRHLREGCTRINTLYVRYVCKTQIL